MWYDTKINGNVIHLACFGREIIYSGDLSGRNAKKMYWGTAFSMPIFFNGDRHHTFREKFRGFFKKKGRRH